MRKVIFKVGLTIDGFIEGPKGEMDWVGPHVGTKEAWKYLNNLLRTVDTVLLSRVLYQRFKQYWPPVATNPSSSKSDKKFSRWLDNIPKVIFSKTLEKGDWKNSRLVKGNLGKEIVRLKKQPGKNLVIFGGAKFPQALMKLGLIDEYWIEVYPVVLGGGKPLFKDIKNRFNLKLLKSTTFESGVVCLRYKPVKLPE